MILQLYSDGWFYAGFNEYLKLRFTGQNFSANAAPTFVYLFAHKGESSLTEYFGGDKETFYGKNVETLFFKGFIQNF